MMRWVWNSFTLLPHLQSSPIANTTSIGHIQHSRQITKTKHQTHLRRSGRFCLYEAIARCNLSPTGLTAASLHKIMNIYTSGTCRSAISFFLILSSGPYLSPKHFFSFRRVIIIIATQLILHPSLPLAVVSIFSPILAELFLANHELLSAISSIQAAVVCFLFFSFFMYIPRPFPFLFFCKIITTIMKA